MRTKQVQASNPTLYSFDEVSDDVVARFQSRLLFDGDDSLLLTQYLSMPFSVVAKNLEHRDGPLFNLALAMPNSQYPF
jgi:hypothetical protein